MHTLSNKEFSQYNFMTVFSRSKMKGDVTFTKPQERLRTVVFILGELGFYDFTARFAEPLSQK